MTCGHLFSGIGGFGIASDAMGWETAFNCEIDPFCQKVLKYYWPNSELYEDITKTDFRQWRGRIDLLSGGFPCQPFSVSGDRKGSDDHRYLWPEMYRCIKEIRPAWIVAENVAGITSMVFPGEEINVEGEPVLFGESYKEAILRERHILESICQDFERIGYSVQPVIIPACAVSAPHRRDRTWIIAHRSDAGVESLQQERENGIYESGITTDAYGNDAGGCGYGKIGRKTRKDKENKEQWEWIRSNTKRVGNEKSLTYSKRCGGDKIQQDVQFKKSDGSRPYGKCSKWTVADSKSIRLSECGQARKWRYGFEDIHSGSNWRDFPTQSPVFSRNDGLSHRLVDITVSRWRIESIKAFGNAIVPDIAIEIFKAINQNK